ncbi:inorganic diphosphatase [Hymenobacter sp. BT18]|uniref:inorganic diphosphatase n=1 Tax=Hymenobacter sp. BT18 TaxID=2835648 RepID=UPI00143E96CF|nr:inorganic diphosphatase [Hymenobacter sp. BT18]QIX60792.1 inorganic diphosphatase [Hymenobacter sp. BT18]
MSTWRSSNRSALNWALLALLTGGASSCSTDYSTLPTYSAERKLLQVVVEVPAGTNHLQHYNPATRQFEAVRRAGLDQVVEFLPSPGNQGFIPSTLAAEQQTPLPALVLAEAQPAGTVVEVQALGLLTLDDGGQLRQVVLATPARPSQQILPGISTWQGLINKYPGVRTVLSQWYQHQGRPGEIRIVSWKDERAAAQAIQQAR